MKYFFKNILLTGLLIFLHTPEAYCQLLDFEISERETTPGQMPPVFRDFPDKAVLVVTSSMSELQLTSTLGVVEERNSPDSGIKRLIIEPRRQLIRVSAPGYNDATIRLTGLNPRDVRYYTIERAYSSELMEAEESYAIGDFNDAIERLNRFLQHSELHLDQQTRAYRFLSFSYAAVGQYSQMRAAARKLLEIEPLIAPDPATIPQDLMRFIVAFQDSLKRVPPASPSGLKYTVSRNGSVSLNWDPNQEEDLFGYYIYRDTDPLRLTRIASLDRTNTSYVDNQIEPFETYYYRVSAHDTLSPPSESGFSTVLSVMVQTVLSERITHLEEEGLITNVEYRMMNNDSTLVIDYDLNAKSKKKHSVSVVLSNNGGETYTIRPAALDGDIGSGVLGGQRKRFYWNFYEDFPAGLSDPRLQLQFDVHRRRNTPWLLAGGAALAGGAVLVIQSMGDSPESLGRPPERPRN